MREGFNTQLEIGRTPIDEVQIPTKTRSHMAWLMAAIQYIWKHKTWRDKVYALIVKHLPDKSLRTGRPGMSLWELFVLGQVRLCMNTSYDEVHHMANYDALLRGVMGVLPTDYSQGKQYEYQTIYDNIGLLSDEMLREINEVVVSVGHEVFKKKDHTALRLKTDSFVVETDTHFPTDYNLLWDSSRKSIALCHKFSRRLGLKDWRKHKHWDREVKGLMRIFSKTCAGGGKNKASRVASTCQAYLLKCQSLSKKVASFKVKYGSCLDPVDLSELAHYHFMLDKHIDLLERRVLKGEVIPHEEKVFSVYQPYTEWINKGKFRPPVEIGKKLCVTTDQYHLIVDYQLGEKQSDGEFIKPMLERILKGYTVQSLSMDKGFSSKSIKAWLAELIPEVIMQKKGKRTVAEKAEESTADFKRLKNQHHAIESNINELEHRGLDRCPDRSLRRMRNYVGLAVCAYNLHKIGRHLLHQRLAEERAREAA